MFSGVLRELSRLRRQKIQIVIPPDKEGFLDRRCPCEKCHGRFKVLQEDWDAKVQGKVMYCPACRHEAPADDWTTPEQIEYAKAEGTKILMRRIGQAVREDGRRLERSQPRKSFIRFSLDWRDEPIFIPPLAFEEMLQRVTCESCKCRYASTGFVFFCPACGHGSIGATFFDTIKSIRQTMASIPTIRAAVTEACGRDAAENTIRDMIEDRVGKLVGSFQPFAEWAYRRLPSANPSPPHNAFQRLGHGSGLFKAACGEGYEDFISAKDLADLGIYFQQRHLLAHRAGIVDQDYIDRSGDSSYAIGQRIVVKSDVVLKMADIINALAVELRKLA